MLTPYGKREWLIILVVGGALIALALYLRWWWAGALVTLATLALLSFFRDPPRRVPSGRGLMISPADGVVSSVHAIEHYQPLGESATCIRIFLSVLDVHVNRSPCDAKVLSLTHKPGKFMNALNPQSAEVNESMLIVLASPDDDQAMAAVRQVSGAIARTIVCRLKVGDQLQRGQRFGMIKFGSTTELYLRQSDAPQVLVHKGQRVAGGLTVLAKLPVPIEPAAKPGPHQAVETIRPA
ncbi:MAG: phosphatidylserine decarboxylase [Phycisphaeraceae bacterium]